MLGFLKRPKAVDIAMMSTSIEGDTRYHITLNIGSSTSSLDSMSSYRTGYSSGPYGYESGSGSNAYSTSSRGDGTGNYQHASLTPPQAEATSRRRSMTIQDMLNPAGEDEKHLSGSHSSSSSSDDERLPSLSHRHLPVPQRDSRTQRLGPYSRRGTGFRTSGSNMGGSVHSRRPSRSPSSSPDVQPRTRAFRPAYTTEEVHFIWYLRIDRGYLWPDIKNAFNARFSDRGEDRRKISGLQCRYYRLLDQNGMPQVRNIPRTADVVQRYGMRAYLARTGQRVPYSWLGGEYPNNAYGHILEEK